MKQSGAFTCIEDLHEYGSDGCRQIQMVVLVTKMPLLCDCVEMVTLGRF